MTDSKSIELRRKLLKSIAAGSGALVAGKSLPDSWTKPVVDSVLIPAHAQTSIPTNYYCYIDPEGLRGYMVAVTGDAIAFTGHDGGIRITPSGTPKLIWTGSGSTAGGSPVIISVSTDLQANPGCVFDDPDTPRDVTINLNASGIPVSMVWPTGDGQRTHDLTPSAIPCALPAIAPCPLNCLAYDTPILIPGSSYRTINTLNIGDMVTAIDEDGSSIYTVVTKVKTQHMRSDYYTINNDLRITDDHPVLVARGGSLVWCRVDSLTAGDKVRSLDGYVDIASIEYHDELLETVYVETQCGNFIAKGGSNHYVVKSTYAEDSERLLKGELKAFA